MREYVAVRCAALYGEFVRDYVIKRTLLIFPALLAISFVIFAMVRAIPGDVVMSQLENAPLYSQADISKLRAQLGLDKPFLVQYESYAGGLVKGDLIVQIQRRILSTQYPFQSIAASTGGDIVQSNVRDYWVQGARGLGNPDSEHLRFVWLDK